MNEQKCDICTRKIKEIVFCMKCREKFIQYLLDLKEDAINLFPVKIEGY